MAALAGGDVAKLRALSAVPYKDQAQWFLNAFWAGETGPCFSANEDKAEEIWAIVNKAVTLDKKKGEEGCELDEWEAHQLLESFGCTLTVEKMRAVLKDIDLDFNKMMSLTEYFIFKFEVDWKTLVNAPQGEEDKEAVAAAAAKVDAAKRAMAEVQASAERSREEAKKAEEEEAQAAIAEKEATEAADAVLAAKAVADAALAELEAQEKAFQDKMSKMEADGSNMELGIVKRNRAKAELAQLKASDPLPLRTAKITQEAAVRKLAKAHKKAAAAAAAASAARATAAAAQAAAEAAAAAAEAAIPEAEAAFEAAQKALQEVKDQIKGAGQGTFWWLDRELIEAMKYMPQAKRAKMEAKMAADKAARGESKQ